jgi:hypothetical protein
MILGKSVLGLSALVFVGYGLTSLVSPAIPAGLAGIIISNGDAFAEIGSMYGGLQTGIGLFCLLALLKPAYYKAGLVLLVLGIGTLALARLFSAWVTTDTLTIYTYGALVFEFFITVLATLALVKTTGPSA